MSLLILEAPSPKASSPTLQKTLQVALMGCPNIRFLGDSKVLAWLCDAHGVYIEGLCAVDVMVRRQLVSLVCIPRRTWGSTVRMQVYEDLAAACLDEGVMVRFVPEHFLMGCLVAEDRAMPGGVVRVGGDALRRMLSHLVEYGRSTLGKVARVSRHPDPYHAVLHMVRVGLLASDPACPVDGNAPIYLPECRR